MTKSVAAAALMLCLAQVQAAEYRVTVVAKPTGWDVEQAVKADLDLFRKNGHTEAQLKDSGDQLRSQYSRLSQEGTRAEGTLSVVRAGEVVKYGGAATWTHLGQQPRLIQGEVQRNGTVEFVQSNGSLRVADLLTSNTLLSPIDLAILAGDTELLATIKAAHEQRMVMVNGQEVPLYKITLTKDAMGNAVGYIVNQSSPAPFLTVTFTKQGDTWRKENFKSNGKLERLTLIEPSAANAIAFKAIPHGTPVIDQRDRELGTVNYAWNGEIPEAETLAALQHRPSRLAWGLAVLGLAVVGGGAWALKGRRTQIS
ncbi:hypothetical protein CCB81_06910 [Armatimonadetes bacterium Uphvl-Ar2]|nr:hypothetical protein CCB81_06910 [Armatimonadetes bacterium Uphvl-Ar2]